MIRRVLLICVCLWTYLCCQAQFTFQKVMVSDSVTNISLAIQKNIFGTTITHLGFLRRGHACIDWSIRGALNVPSVVFDYDGTEYPLTTIGFHSFYKCVGLTKVTLPPTVRLLCYEAFYGCSALNEIYMSDSLLVVGERSFCGCTSLRRIFLPCAVPPHCSADAFDATTYQQARIIVPKGCREAYLATEPWKRFVQIEESDEAKTPATNANYDYWLRIKDFLESIHEDELWRMPQRVEGDETWVAVLATDRGPQQVVFSTRRAFDMAMVGSGQADECCIDTTFTGTLALPDSITAPDGRRMVVGGVAMNAFSGCRQLQQVELPPHLQFIDNLAFYDCKALRQVILPADMKEIMTSAFAGCSGLNRVETLAQTPPDLFVDAFDNRTFNTATLVMPEGASEAYMATDAWPLFRYRMESIEK